MAERAIFIVTATVSIFLALTGLSLAIHNYMNMDKPFTSLKNNDIMQIIGKVSCSTEQNGFLLAQEADTTPNGDWRPASAHVTLRPSGLYNCGCDPDLNKPRNDVSSTDENCNCPLKLNSDLDKDYEHAQNTIVTSECLTLKYPGLYYVYASVNFKPNSAHCARNLTETLVMRWRVSTKSGRPPHSQQVLFCGVLTCLRNCHEFEKSSFSGRNFFLQVNDTLFVEVSDDSIVNFGQTSSYLGAHSLVEN